MQDSAATPAKARPSWVMRALVVLLRTVFLTLLFTALGMGLGLTVGIITMIISSMVHHSQPEMANAYRHFAIPTAIVTGSCALLWNVVAVVRDAVRKG